MLFIDRTEKFDYNNTPIDAFWNLGEQPESKMHRIHAYPAKFPAFLASKAMQFAEDEKLCLHLVGDIFCGCGTVAYESLRKNVNFWGCDINPVAVLIAKTKSCKYNDRHLHVCFDKIAKTFANSKDDKRQFSQIARERIEYWFEQSQIAELSKLYNAILSSVPPSSNYRGFFLCAFSNILKGTSRWLTKSIKPQIDPNKKTADVWDSYVNQFSVMHQASNENDISPNSNVNIKCGNFLSLNTSKEFSLIMTSPPYVTSYEYADLHQLSSLWLGYAEDYRTLRNGSIGSLYNSFDLGQEVKHLNPVGTQVVLSLQNKDKSQARSVAKYYLDMQKVTTKVHRILSPKGWAIFVIGETEYKGVRIENAKHLVESLFHAGFTKVGITKRKISNKILTPYRDAIGRFSSDSENRHVYAEEFIIVGKK